MNYKGQRVVATKDMKLHYYEGDKATVVGVKEEMLLVVLDRTPENVSTVLAENFKQDKEEPLVKEAREIIATNETEEAHVKLDELLCNVLEKNGYTELVKVFNGAPKWYA